MVRSRALFGLALACLLFVVILVAKRQPRVHVENGNQAEPAEPSAASQRPGSFPLKAAENPAPAPAGASTQGGRALWEARLARAEFTLKEYLKSTRYPPDSRPLREHPDRIYPRAKVTRTLPLGSHGQPGGDVQIKLSQDRLSLVEDDTVQLSVRCEDSLAAAVPCTLQGARAVAAGGAPASSAARLAPAAPVPINFSDDGGAHTALFQPAQQGFRGYSGPLRVAFTVNAGDESGELFFDLVYTSDPPARFTGQVREAVEGGSLQLYVGIAVKKPGRYVITGRADDAGDRPFAYLQWNDLLSPGPQEVKLTVFGKLIRDEDPQWPLKLRDVDGFLLFEDQDPDRQELPMLAGLAYSTRPHSPGEFSAEEWQSEERDRYIQEFSKDVATAKSALTRP